MGSWKSGIHVVASVAHWSRVATLVAIVLSARLKGVGYDSSLLVQDSLLFEGAGSGDGGVVWKGLDGWVQEWLGPLGAWDGVFFSSIMDRGYAFEQYHAFFPGYALASRFVCTFLVLPLLHSVHFVASFFSPAQHPPSTPLLSPSSLHLISALLTSHLSFILAATSLYLLSRRLLHRANVALLSSLLFCLSPSTVFFSATYTEALFAFFSFAGMLALETAWDLGGDKAVVGVVRKEEAVVEEGGDGEEEGGEGERMVVEFGAVQGVDEKHVGSPQIGPFFQAPVLCLFAAILWSAATAVRSNGLLLIGYLLFALLRIAAEEARKLQLIPTTHIESTTSNTQQRRHPLSLTFLSSSQPPTTAPKRSKATLKPTTPTQRPLPPTSSRAYIRGCGCAWWDVDGEDTVWFGKWAEWGWRMVWSGVWGMVLIAIILLPFYLFQAYGYAQFCAPFSPTLRILLGDSTISPTSPSSPHIPTFVLHLSSSLRSLLSLLFHLPHRDFHALLFPSSPALYPTRPYCSHLLHLSTSTSPPPQLSLLSNILRSPLLTPLLHPIYGFIQEQYWDVGFLKFWTVSQLPNFLLATPTLLLSLWSLREFTSPRSTTPPTPIPSRLAPSTTPAPALFFATLLHISLLPFSPCLRCLRLQPLLLVQPTPNQHKPIDFFNQASSPRLLPYLLHALFLALFALTSMHVHVVTRLIAAASPLQYWALAALWQRGHAAKATVAAVMVLYAVAGVVMFPNFLPWV